MKAIKIQIIKFISDDQPGFVECRFYDAFGKEHIVQDKVPIVTEKLIDANSKYPKDGIIACEIVKHWKDTNGRTIFMVDTSKPWGIETIDGQTQFDIYEEQLYDN